MSLKQRSAPDGFTLVEMLFVIIIAGILIGLSISAFDKMRDNLAPRLAAMEFMSALKTAHQYSMNNSMRTRLVFADSNVTSSVAGTGLVPTNSYGIYAFYVPEQPMGGTQYNSNSVGNEYSLMPTLSIPQGFSGQWIPCPLQSRWRTISTRVVISDSAQFFASGTNITNFYASNYYVPQQTWVKVDSTTTNLYGSNTMNATYPSNYTRTPYPSSYALITTNVAPSESSYLANGQGGNVPYYSSTTNFVWPTNVNYRYFSTAQTPTFYDLPGVEFDTRGFPTFKGTNITFVFTEKKNTNNYYQVVIDSTVGIPRMIGPTGP